MNISPDIPSCRYVGCGALEYASVAESKPEPKEKETRVTWAHCARDVILRAMDRGQMLPLLGFICVAAIVIKLPQSDVSALSREVLRRLVDLSLLGWMLWVVTALSAIGHAKYIRRLNSIEMDRITEERNKAQTSLIGPKNTPSSKAKKQK